MPVAKRILTGLVGLFFLAMGLGFWFAIENQSAGFGLETGTAIARASIRADFGAFFLAVGGMSLIAAWKQSASWATAPLILLALALSGRIVSLLLDGPAPGGFSPMVVEAACIAVLAWARTGWRGA